MENEQRSDEKSCTIKAGHKTYKKPSERTRTTESLVRRSITMFQTKKIGRIPKDQSVIADITA